MPDVTLDVIVPLPPEKAFDAFVQQMDVWWPRQGVFPFSFAPKSTGPLHIRFEPRLGGRYYETFLDQTEYEIGRIKAWDPPARLAYTWRDPTWPGETRITLSFGAADAGARVIYEQDGFAEAGLPELAAYYQIGCRQTLSAYVAHCHALHELGQLNQALTGD
ncbi:MAG: SRPBCC domain-containing protein [Chloroflexota bacterium]|nr:SRPBCC domain-containing protein [Chloroflexota bacterium]MDE2948778.1 SRPBCC domain-containing protein [Chloroflexota bacterium]